MSDTVDLDVRKAGGFVEMRPHQVQRDVRRGGKTTEAAIRLATYRLRYFLRGYGWERVDDVTVRVEDDLTSGCRRIAATTRCLDRLEMQRHGIQPGFRIPSGTPSRLAVRAVAEATDG